MIEIVFSDLEHDFEKNPLFCLSEDHKEYMTTRRFSYFLKKAFGDLEDYADWKNSLYLIDLKKAGMDFGDEDDSLEELDQLDNYSEELCGIAFNSILLGEIFLKNLGENYDIDFTFLPNPEMIIIRFLDKKFRKTRIKIKLVGQLELDHGYYCNINLALQQYFTDLFKNKEDNKFRPYSLFHVGEHPIERIFNAEKTLYVPDYHERDFLPVFREIIGKMLIEIIVYDYYWRK